jgi:hypothetical protein
MGLLSDAAATARGRVGVIYLTAALSLVPAYLVGGAIVFVAVAHATAEPDLTRGEALAERRALPADAPAEERRDVLRQAASEPGAPRRPAVSLTVAAGLLFGGLVFLAGLFLAQAALLGIAAGGSGPSAAWAAVAARFHALGHTLAATLALVALGSMAAGVPGLFAAFAFSLAAAVAMAEDASGFPALHRSWQLIKGVWPSQLGLVLWASALVVLFTQGLGRLLPGRAVLAHALLDAAVAVVILPLPVFASAVLYLRAWSKAEGKPVEDLLQYIRRTSERG